LITRFPLALQLANVNGAIFTDVGAAWNNDDFKGATSSGGSLELQDIKAGFGFGLRANLFGWILLRYDLAWATNLARVSDHPRHYFSFGAEF
jgi:outer membrane protein assembly factor BamA